MYANGLRRYKETPVSKEQKALELLKQKKRPPYKEIASHVDLPLDKIKEIAKDNGLTKKIKQITKTFLTDAQKEKAKDLYEKSEKKMTLNEIKKEIGFFGAPSTIKSFLVQEGLFQTRNSKKLTEEQKALIRDYWKQEYSQMDIAEKVGCTRIQVQYFLATDRENLDSKTIPKTSKTPS